MSLIMDMNSLLIGQSYKLVSNAGYFSQLCTLTRIHVGGMYCFRDSAGREHYVHAGDLWRDDNPVRIYSA